MNESILIFAYIGFFDQCFLPCAVLLMLWLKSGYVKGLLVPSMLRDPLIKMSSNFYGGCKVSIMRCSPHSNEIFFGRGFLMWERLLMWPSQHHRYKLVILKNMDWNYTCLTSLIARRTKVDYCEWLQQLFSPANWEDNPNFVFYFSDLSTPGPIIGDICNAVHIHLMHTWSL